MLKNIIDGGNSIQIIPSVPYKAESCELKILLSCKYFHHEVGYKVKLLKSQSLCSPLQTFYKYKRTSEFQSLITTDKLTKAFVSTGRCKHYQTASGRMEPVF